MSFLITLFVPFNFVNTEASLWLLGLKTECLMDANQSGDKRWFWGMVVTALATILAPVIGWWLSESKSNASDVVNSINAAIEDYSGDGNVLSDDAPVKNTDGKNSGAKDNKKYLGVSGLESEALSSKSVSSKRQPSRLSYINVANVEKGMLVESNVFELGIAFDVDRLFDDDFGTVFRVNSAQLRNLKFTIILSEPYTVKFISIYQPPGIDIGEHLNQLYARYEADGAWSEWQLLNVASGSGEIFLPSFAEGEVSKIEFNPVSNNLSYGYATIGDISVYSEL